MYRPEERMLYYPSNPGAGILAGVLACFLIAPASWGAPIDQEPLKIVTLQGEGAVNDTKTKTVTEPVVEVRDSRELPVADAEVIFQLPSLGPSGVFPDRSRILKTKTNSQGQAMAAGYVPNDETGRF